MKQLILTALVLSSVLFFACKETPKTDNNAAATADSAANRGIEAAAAPTVPHDSLIVNVDSMGKVTMGNREISLDDLPKVLVDSSRFLEKATGKAPKAIVCKSNGAMMGIRGAVHDAIDDAQDSLKKVK